MLKFTKASENPNCKTDILALYMKRIRTFNYNFGTFRLYDPGKRKSYTKIGTDKRYKNLTVNHSKNFVDPISEADTQPIERT
ncbi:hypothetical protein HZS_7480 [Henneguya salminicola]|nr:hypothetical protein HZS_7480 [Henneguya salminicola]